MDVARNHAKYLFTRWFASRQAGFLIRNAIDTKFTHRARASLASPYHRISL